MISIQNNDIKIEVRPFGAELQSIYHLQHQLEYLWTGDPVFWGKRSPVLFPIVGQLKEDTYYYQARPYKLPRHGFAREKEFITEHVGRDEATFLLIGDEETKTVYPFRFEFRIHYALDGSTLKVTYDVHNIGNDLMFFSVGGHPAFKVPVATKLAYNDYYLEFEHPENCERRTLQSGLIDDPVPFLNFEKHLPLSHELFYKDAIVLKNLKSSYVSLKSDKDPHGFSFNFGDFPFLGIWAAKNAPFLCIEPWQGIADSVRHSGQLTDKEGIIHLSNGHRWQEAWSISFW